MILVRQCFLIKATVLRKQPKRMRRILGLEEISSSEPLVSIDRTASCGEALKLMVKHHIHHLVVTENNDPVGILSDRDIFFRWFKGGYQNHWDFEISPIGPSIRTHLPCITEKTTLLEATDWMGQFRTSALLVKRGLNKWGIITDTDLLKSLVTILQRKNWVQELALTSESELSTPLVQKLIDNLVQAGL